MCRGDIRRQLLRVEAQVDQRFCLPSDGYLSNTLNKAIDLPEGRLEARTSRSNRAPIHEANMHAGNGATS
jgi:hypothetical protein